MRGAAGRLLEALGDNELVCSVGVGGYTERVGSLMRLTSQPKAVEALLRACRIKGWPPIGAERQIPLEVVKIVDVRLVRVRVGEGGCPLPCRSIPERDVDRLQPGEATCNRQGV